MNWTAIEFNEEGFIISLQPISRLEDFALFVQWAERFAEKHSDGSLIDGTTGLYAWDIEAEDPKLLFLNYWA